MLETIVEITDDVPSANVDLMPFKIQFSGSLETPELYKSSKQNQESSSLKIVTASFRGLKLVGETISLGEKVGYVCNSSELVKRKDDQPESLETFKVIRPIARFDELTIFGHESLPSENNKWKLSREWEAVSDAIHS